MLFWVLICEPNDLMHYFQIFHFAQEKTSFFDKPNDRIFIPMGIGFYVEVHPDARVALYFDNLSISSQPSMIGIIFIPLERNSSIKSRY